MPSAQRALALIAGASLAVLAGCASGPRTGSGFGRDGAEANPPSGLMQVPDAQPRVEAIRSSGGTSKPYVVMGRSYVPIVDDRPFRETGLASWYGRKFHSMSTASGEPYDMYAMTAAHKTLPLPSYVRVRNPNNGREVIVRVNDRGPFHEDRIIDLSYTAALKLDLLRGVAPVEIERITNDDIRTGAWRRGTDEGGSTFALRNAAGSATPGGAVMEAVPVAAATGTWRVSPVSTASSASPVASAPAASVQESVSVPAVLTSPVVAAPGAEVRDLAALPAQAPEAASGPERPAAPMVLGTGGFFVQLGAFSQREGADRLRQQIAREMPSLAASLVVFTERGTHRLQAGPYGSRQLARDAADEVRASLQLAPIVVERR